MKASVSAFVILISSMVASAACSSDPKTLPPPPAVGVPIGGDGKPACFGETNGVLAGVTHAQAQAGWITEVSSAVASAGPYAVRLFDSCFGTDVGEPSQCSDTIDYVDGAKIARRLPYRVAAPVGFSASAGRRPVVLFQHGGGPNPKGQRGYTNLVKLLASHGYIVVQTAVMPSCAAGACSAESAERLAYCQVYAQSGGSDCKEMNLMYYNRPNDFKAVATALPRVFRTVDFLAGAEMSLGLSSLADPTRIAVMGHSAGTNGVLSLGGAGFDYVSTPSGTNVDQRDRYFSAFLAIGPNSSSSDNGRGWDAEGFSKISDESPFLFISGSRDYAVDVAACDRPLAFMSARPGNKYMQYTVKATHASEALNDEDDATVDKLAAKWTPDRCAPQTSPARGSDTFGPAKADGTAATTPLEKDIYSSTASVLLPFLAAELSGDSAALATLQAASDAPASFNFGATQFLKRGYAPDIKVLAPRTMVLSAECSAGLPVSLLRRGDSGVVELSVEGLPAGASSAPVRLDEKTSEAKLQIARGSADPGTYRVQVIGSSPAKITGTEITLVLN